MPTGFTNQETQKDFAEELGDLNPSEPEKAKELWQTAKKELGIEKAELTILSSDTENAKKISEYVQGALADNLENLTVNVSPVPFNNRLEKVAAEISTLWLVAGRQYMLIQSIS